MNAKIGNEAPSSTLFTARKQAVFTGLLLAVFLIGLEVTIRLVIPQYPYYPRFLYIEDPHMGYRFRPNFSGQLQHQDFSVSIDINSAGFRDDEVETPKTKFRLLALGDSSTMGVGVEAEEIFWSKVERRFDNLEVVNAGMGATGTLHQLALYEHYGAQLEPDLVVLLFANNDLDDNMEGFSRTIRGGYVIPTQSRWPLLQIGLNFLSDYYQTFHLAAERARKVSGIYRIFRDDQRAQIGAQGVTPRKIAYAQELLERLHSSVASSGAQLVVVFGGGQWFSEFSGWLREREVPTFELGSHLDGEEDIRFPNDGHWNARGHSIVAGLVSDFLVRSGLFPGDVTSSEP